MNRVLVSSALIEPTEISESDLRGARDAGDVVRIIDRRRRADRSLRQVAPQTPEDAGAVRRLPEGVVQFPEALTPGDRAAEIPDHQIQSGRRLAASIRFAVYDAQVRG